jgi:hypothetical protein
MTSEPGDRDAGRPGAAPHLAWGPKAALRGIG